MARNPPDERLVFLALKTIFKGVDAQLRNIKKIRKHILNHQENDEVHSLIEEHNIDNVANAARVLLEQGIFSSTLKAKIRFPEVFDVSPAQSAERSASEAEAAKSEADAIKHATEGYQDELTTDLSIAYKEGEGKAREGPTRFLLANRRRRWHLDYRSTETFLNTSCRICSITVSCILAP